MGPIIILDKSAIQALSQQEIYFLFKHYYVVVTPILIMEILADLKKSTDEIGLSKREVQQLSKKLLSSDSVINTNFKDLYVGSLVGRDIPMTGQAIVNGEIPIETSRGEKGIFLDEPWERKALRNWESGIFSNTEEIIAQKWRETTQALNLEDHKRKLKGLLKDMPKPEDFKELDLYVERYISNPVPLFNFLV
jgi:hypothetical protein